VTKKIRSHDDEIEMLIRGFGSPGEVKSAKEFFQILQEAGESFVPTKLGLGEPLRTPYSIENAKKIWVKSGENRPYGGILFKGPSLFGSSDWNNRDNSNSFSLTISSKIVMADEGIKRFITFVKKLFIWCNGIYGYTTHDLSSMYSPGLDYKTCLGGITWMNLFGKPYVKMFGREVIKTAPCMVEEFAEDCFMLLTAETPIRANSKLLEIQERVKDHLGRDAFCRLNEVPTFLTMEDLRAGRDRPSTEGYRSPDLSEYLKDLGAEKDEGLIAVVNEDGTITTYKVEERPSGQPLKREKQ
jgi:hypothetical protein